MYQTYINVVEVNKLLINVSMNILWERKNLGLISDDSRGQLFSLDLLFALIPLVLVLGIVASDMDAVMNLVQDTVFQGSTERVAADTVNTLLETSGQPTYWEQNGSATIAGLAPCDSNGVPIEGVISTAKLSALTSSDVQKIVGNNYGFYLNISEIDNSTFPVSYRSIRSISSDGSGINSTTPNIVKVEKTALYSNVVYSIIGQIKGSGTSRSYNTPTFNCFQTNSFSNQTYDYWILIDNNGYAASNVTVTINNGTVNLQNSSGTSTFLTLINSTFLNLNSSTPVADSVTVTASGKPDSYMDFYIVQMPKGVTPASGEEDQKSCRFEFYLWAK